MSLDCSVYSSPVLLSSLLAKNSTVFHPDQQGGASAVAAVVPPGRGESESVTFEQYLINQRDSALEMMQCVTGDKFSTALAEFTAAADALQLMHNWRVSTMPKLVR